MTTAITGNDALDALFLRCLIDRIRAEDSFSASGSTSDNEVLGDFVVTREQRRAIPIIGDPDPDTIDRIGYFYQAAGLAVERRTGLVASPMMTIHHEGFGRVVLLTGCLVLYARSLRDVHRFGFDSSTALASAGGAVVAKAIAMIEAHPDLARA